MFLLFVCLIPLLLGEPRFCPMDADKDAFRIIESEIRSVFHSQRIPMPVSCPFHSSHDRMQTVRQCRQLVPGRVRCAFCQHEEASMQLMMEHMRRNHSKDVSEESTRCFSDYCDILGCAKVAERDWKMSLFKCRQVVGQCVEDRTSVAYGLLLSNLCSKFDGITVEKQDGSKRVLQILGLVFISLCVVVFYVIVCLWRTESKSSDEFQSKPWFKKKGE